MSATLYRLLIASGVLFAVSLSLAVLDALGWLVLPQAIRPGIPIALVGSTLLGIVLLSGSIGIPKNPRAETETPATDQESEIDADEEASGEHSAETS